MQFSQPSRTETNLPTRIRKANSALSPRLSTKDFPQQGLTSLKPPPMSSTVRYSRLGLGWGCAMHPPDQISQRGFASSSQSPAAQVEFAHKFALSMAALKREWPFTQYEAEHAKRQRCFNPVNQEHCDTICYGTVSQERNYRLPPVRLTSQYRSAK